MGSVLSLVAATAVCGVGGLGLLAVHSRLHARGEHPDRHRLRRVVRGDLLLVSLAAVVGLFVSGARDLGTVLLDVAGGPTGGPLAALAWGPLVVGVAVAVSVASLGAVSDARDRRTTPSRRRTFLRTFRNVLTFGIAAVALVAAVSAAATADARLGAAVVIATALLASVLSPYAVSLTQRTFPPEGRRADRLDRLCSDVNLTGPNRRLIDSRNVYRAPAVVRGVGPLRTLFVTDYVFDEFGDDVVRALLAVRTARIRVRLPAVRLTGFLVLAGVSAWAFEHGFASLLIVAGVGVIGHSALSRRLAFRADEFAAERVGTAKLADALESVADARKATAKGRIRRFLSPTPGLRWRATRLRGPSTTG